MFLDLSKDEQECTRCPSGSYSLGGGVRYENWEKLPSGFTVKQEQFELPSFMRGESPTNEDDSDTNCTQ